MYTLKSIHLFPNITIKVFNPPNQFFCTFYISLMNQFITKFILYIWFSTLGYIDIYHLHNFFKYKAHFYHCIISSSYLNHTLAQLFLDQSLTSTPPFPTSILDHHNLYLFSSTSKNQLLGLSIEPLVYHKYPPFSSIPLPPLSLYHKVY